MTLEKCDALLVLPYRKAWLGGPEIARIPGHGRILRNGLPVDGFPETGRAALLAGAERQAGRFLYGGPMKIHFGHLLCDSIARLHGFDPALHDKVVFPALGCRADSVPDWVYAVLALFGLSRDQVLVVDRPMILERVDFARPGTGIGQPEPPSQAYLDSLPGNRVRHPYPLASRDIYLGRHHILHKGTVMGEGHLIAALEQAGFVAVRPEELPIEAQVAMLREARRVVFMEGSAISSIELLAASQARFYMIPRRNGLVERFQRMIGPRAPFSPAFDQRAVHRLRNRAGRSGPASPSILGNPAAAFAEMAALGLVPAGAFSLDAFLEAERQDFAAYARDDADWLDSRMQDVARLRAA